MERYISKLDTERFGFKIARVDDFGDSNSLGPPNPSRKIGTSSLRRGAKTSIESVGELVDKLKSDGVKLIMSKVDLDDLALINELEKIGFEIKDIQVTYKFDLTKEPSGDVSLPQNCKIRVATINDLEKLVEIADESFYGYGHYFADKRLDPAKCGEIYKDWISRSIIDKKVADVVFVAEIDDEIAGFYSVKTIKNDHYYAAGVQGAVASKYRNKSVFRRINLHAIEWSRGLGLEWIENNVILTNYPVNYSYSKIGFKIVRGFGTFHYWVR